jgi:dGTPase
VANAGAKPIVGGGHWRQHGGGSRGVLVGLDGSIVADLAAATRRYRRPGVTGTSAVTAPDTRSETERDRGRLSYSAQLRRLAGVTQVVSPDLQTAQLHSRASHTHKVALIAREIAEKLARSALTNKSAMAVIKSHGGLDIAACEAAGLAHDLGHPPFGHVGEQVLEAELRATPGVWEGFEGNAQSFRIVTTLAHQKAETDDPGLALTSVTLAAILKYPYLRDLRTTPAHPHGEGHQKFGAYGSEAELMWEVRDDIVPGNADRDYLVAPAAKKPAQSLEASVMDLADDIAYSVHDLEDFCARGTIDLRLVHAELGRALKALKSSGTIEATNVFVTAKAELAKDYATSFSPTAYHEALASVMNTFDLVAKTQTQPSPGLFESTLREQLSGIVNEFFEAIRCDGEADKPPVYLDTAAWHKMQVLKRVTRRYLVNTPAVGQVQRAQIVAMRRLFKGTVKWLQDADSASTLPVKLQEILAGSGLLVTNVKPPGVPSAEHYRAVADYICTMSDSEAFEVAQWLAGARVPGARSDP